MHSTVGQPPSIERVRRVDRAALAYTLARVKILERISGNPIGVDYATIDGATALLARNLPSVSFNSVFGLRSGQTHLVRPLVDWYRERGSVARFEIAAGDHDAALGRELARLGFFQSGFHAALIGEPDASFAFADAYPAEPVASDADTEDFLDAYVEGWGVPEAMRAQFRFNVRPWSSESGWSLYVARVDGRPAASAILFVDGGVGYFADSATDPAFRGRGLHAAMLRRRWREASAAGVDFVCSGAYFLSTSHRNMERAGMKLLYLRAIWTPLR